MEDLLDSWPGTLIVVSHDRYLMERVTDDQFALLDGKLRHVPGGVDEFLKLSSLSRAQREQTQARARSLNQSPKLSASTTQEVDVYQLRKQISSIERKLHTLQNKDDKLTVQMHAADPTDFEQLIKLGQYQSELREQRAELEQEWLEKSERLDS
jgi:ATPase subunit of ABC transporter with duplicated ATPase domains